MPPALDAPADRDALGGAAQRVQRLAVLAIVGQSLFPLSWLVAGGVESGYSHEKQYVSELGARGAEHRWLFDLGDLALGLSFVALGLALSVALRHRPWFWLPPALFVIIGLLTAAEALLPLDCASSIDSACRAQEKHWDLSWQHYAHGFVGLVVQVLLATTPFALALALRPGRLSRLALGLGLIGLLIGVGHLVVASVDDARLGIYQRAGLVVMQGWAYLLAGALLLAAVVRPVGFAHGAPGRHEERGSG
jgi:uncharacterized protein DUF998